MYFHRNFGFPFDIANQERYTRILNRLPNEPQTFGRMARLAIFKEDPSGLILTWRPNQACSLSAPHKCRSGNLNNNR
jgi:hypothetical protein